MTTWASADDAMSCKLVNINHGALAAIIDRAFSYDQIRNREGVMVVTVAIDGNDSIPRRKK
jgi:hypothetical protein